MDEQHVLQAYGEDFYRYDFDDGWDGTADLPIRFTDIGDLSDIPVVASADDFDDEADIYQTGGLHDSDDDPAVIEGQTAGEYGEHQGILGFGGCRRSLRAQPIGRSLAQPRSSAASRVMSSKTMAAPAASSPRGSLRAQ